jgi:hypothetical protein
MPQLGLGLRANISGISLYDGDAAAYFTTAGITDATAKAQINAFVKGIKNLGAWSSIVFWMLRSNQNAGAGTTAYSLGGYGTYNGSLSSSGLWATDGLSITNASYLNTGLTLGASPNSLFAIINVDSDPGANNAYIFTAGVNQNGRQFYGSASGVVPYDTQGAGRDAWFNLAADLGYPDTGLAARTGKRYISWRPQSNTTLNGTMNNTFTTATINGWAASSAGIIRPTGNTGAYKMAFFAFANMVISDSLDSQIRSLYKTTIGTGFGLI